MRTAVLNTSTFNVNDLLSSFKFADIRALDLHELWT